MRWHTVLPLSVVAHVRDDSDVQGVIGDDFYMIGERAFKCPSLRWNLIANVEGENFEESLLTFDFWVRTVADAATLEAALRRLLHHEAVVTIGGVKLWSKYVDSRPLGGAKDGTIARSIDFRQTYLRGRLVA